ncbi:hypothetical protein IL45_04715 [Nonlabens ulvanivorans]|uniref:PRTase-CE domain-containing protein n=1 Tax=Nonlabens ulvanivorans TaxID=906888 RepID=A0A084JX34_NONUL|nr:uracil phosphoribosyltransferase [Nonlabens ulvanivorans]KEZ93518.1 hypothetical protein IL45_04715 [Nonlabens ulvanivorans]
MRLKKNSKLTFSEITNLKESFIEKGWDKFLGFDAFFDNYCDFLEELNKEQCQLIGELTDDFLWIPDISYFENLIIALNKLTQFEHLNFDKIYIVPILSNKDRKKNKPKSSTKVAYEFQSTLLNFDDRFGDSEFIVINNYETLPKKSKIEGNNHPVILVDDFIGTGESAITALSELLAVRQYSNKHLFFLTLVGQEKGLHALKAKGYNVAYSILRKMGLDDKYVGAELQRNKDIMNSIEDVLEKDLNFERIKYSFGYKNSQSLVSMVRTPNNTFPLYWFSPKLNDNKKRKAPFPR